MKNKNSLRFRKGILSGMLLFLIFLLSCSGNLRSKKSIIKVYNNHKEAFRTAASEKSFKELEKIRGIQKVTEYETHAEMECGYGGFASQTRYYGLFYTETDDILKFKFLNGASERYITEEGDGYRYKEPGGDNEVYIEPLGDHYYYYEAKF